jgi:hypothetical protein
MTEMVPFGINMPSSDPIFNVESIPKEMDIYFKSEQSFLPDGKTFSELTPEEEARLRSQYRFSPFKPGIYQTLTGMSGTGRGGMF